MHHAFDDTGNINSALACPLTAEPHCDSRRLLVFSNSLECGVWNLDGQKPGLHYQEQVSDASGIHSSRHKKPSITARAHSTCCSAALEASPPFAATAAAVGSLLRTDLLLRHLLLPLLLCLSDGLAPFDTGAAASTTAAVADWAAAEVTVLRDSQHGICQAAAIEPLTSCMAEICRPY